MKNWIMIGIAAATGIATGVLSFKSGQKFQYEKWDKETIEMLKWSENFWKRRYKMVDDSLATKPDHGRYEWKDSEK